MARGFFHHDVIAFPRRSNSDSDKVLLEDAAQARHGIMLRAAKRWMPLSPRQATGVLRATGTARPGAALSAVLAPLSFVSGAAGRSPGVLEDAGSLSRFDYLHREARDESFRLFIRFVVADTQMDRLGSIGQQLEEQVVPRLY